jgi:DNA-binding GntR family transcriptional regulator
MENDMDFLSTGLQTIESLPVKTSIGQHIFSQLKEAILKGDITPGNRLVENKIAKASGISRTPVREAFHKLESEGLIKPIPQGGYVVTGLTKEEVEDIFGIRSLLESYAAGLAAKNHNESDLLALDEKNREAQKCLDENRLENLPKINTNFHDILYSMSGRPKLIEMIYNLQAQTYRFRKIILSEKKHAEISLKTHKELVRALKKRDAGRVETLIRKHILRGRGIVLKALENEKGEF